MGYLELSVTPAYSEPYLIQNHDYSEPEQYSELYQCIFWYIQKAV